MRAIDSFQKTEHHLQTFPLMSFQPNAAFLHPLPPPIPPRNCGTEFYIRRILVCIQIYKYVHGDVHILDILCIMVNMKFIHTRVYFVYYIQGVLGKV